MRACVCARCSLLLACCRALRLGTAAAARPPTLDEGCATVPPPRRADACTFGHAAVAVAAPYARRRSPVPPRPPSTSPSHEPSPASGTQTTVSQTSLASCSSRRLSSNRQLSQGSCRGAMHDGWGAQRAHSSWQLHWWTLDRTPLATRSRLNVRASHVPRRCFPVSEGRASSTAGTTRCTRFGLQSALVACCRAS